MKKFMFALWCSLLGLPFMGVKGTLYLFAGICAAYSVFVLLNKAFSRMAKPVLPKNLKYFYAALAFYVIVLPFTVKDYYIDVAILCGIYIILAFGVNVVIGFSGLLHLGFAAFYGIGAYSNALLTTSLGMDFWTALPLTLIITTMSGVLLAFPALRLHGDYLAIVTLGFGEIIRLVLNNWDSLTRAQRHIKYSGAVYFRI